MKRINEQTVDKWLAHHAPMAAEGTIADGTLVGGWRIAALVSRGGFGEVYRAVEETTGNGADAETYTIYKPEFGYAETVYPTAKFTF